MLKGKKEKIKIAKVAKIMKKTKVITRKEIQNMSN